MNTNEPDGSAPLKNYLELVGQVAESDVKGLKKSYISYGDSWKRRGGIGAFMMLARKWDRLENRVGSTVDTGKMIADPYNIFEHIEADTRGEGLIDDIRDLRRYLMLVEAEMLAQGIQLGGHRDNA